MRSKRIARERRLHVATLPAVQACRLVGGRPRRAIGRRPRKVAAAYTAMDARREQHGHVHARQSRPQHGAARAMRRQNQGWAESAGTLSSLALCAAPLLTLLHVKLPGSTCYRLCSSAQTSAGIAHLRSRPAPRAVVCSAGGARWHTRRMDTSSGAPAADTPADRGFAGTLVIQRKPQGRYQGSPHGAR